MRSPSPAVALAAALVAVLGVHLAACDELQSAADAGARDAATSRRCGARIPAGTACAVAGDCDDGCFCGGAERCEEGVCVAGADPCGDAFECTRDTCDESVRGCAHAPSAAACSDGDACNGSERCDVALGCVRGSAPACDDDDDCTSDSCAADRGCLHEPRDRDGDGVGDALCGGTDCVDDPDEGGASVAPGRPELCGNDLDDDCDGLRDYATPGCVPTNDTCATARLLPGAGSFSGSARGLADDYLLRCPASLPGDTVADAVYRVTLTETRDLAVRVRGLGGRFGASPNVAVRRFTECATGPELRERVCGGAYTLRIRSAAAGDYAILVSGNASGAFDLIVDIGPPTIAPPIDRCDASTLEVSAGGSFRGTRGDLSDDYGLACSSVLAPDTRADAAYRLTLDAAKDVRIDLRPGGALALVRDCADAQSTLVCVPDRLGRASSIFRRALPAGTYFLLAEPSFSGPLGGTGDDFALDVRVAAPTVAPAADSCSSAARLTPGIEVATPLDALALDIGLSCAPRSWPFARDLAYEFTTTTVQDVTLRLSTPTGAFTRDAPLLVLTRTCGEALGERSCEFIEGVNLLERTWRSLPAGTWFVVAGTTATTGAARALLTLAPATAAPSNDSCDGAAELSSGVPVTFSPASYDDDLSLSCGFGTAPDAVYRFTLPRRQTVAITASPVGAAGETRVAVRSVCATGPDLACTQGAPSSMSTTLEAGTYYPIVEADPSIPQVRVTPIFTEP